MTIVKPNTGLQQFEEDMRKERETTRRTAIRTECICLSPDYGERGFVKYIYNLVLYVLKNFIINMDMTFTYMIRTRTKKNRIVLLRETIWDLSVVISYHHKEAGLNYLHLTRLLLRCRRNLVVAEEGLELCGGE